jgi:ABC-type glycerol-3-phosphate transport system substrate-binding protein
VSTGARLFLFVGAFCLAIAACGGTETAESDNRTESPQATAPATTVTGRCEKVSSAVLNAIAEGLTVTGGGTLRNGYAVKSDDFSKVYMVAADIQGAGMEGDNEIGVWATNSLDGAGLIFAVDGVAKEFSDWGHGDTTDAHITQSSDGVSEAKECTAK